jgi:hypothetical protein
MNGNGIGDNTGFLTISSIEIGIGATEAIGLITGGVSTYTVLSQTSTAVDFLQFGGAGYIKSTAAGNIIDIATGNIQTQATSTINTVPHTVFTGSVRAGGFVSTGAIFAAGATLTSTLNMSDNPINIRNDGTTGLAYGSAAPYSVGIDGAYLFGNTQGALGTTSNANDISLAWDAAEVNIYKTLDMEDNFILNVSTITASGELSISANNDILTSAVSTINTVSNTYFSGGVSRRLDGVGVLQPVIQYGQVSSSGSSGAVIVSTPQAYSAVNTYLPFACMADAPAAELYVSTLTEQAFEIGWQNGGGGNQLFNWHTMGT